MKVSSQVLVLAGQVVLLLFVHLLLDDYLFCDLQTSAGPPAVNVGSHLCRLYPGLQTPVGSARRGDVCSFLVLFMGSFSLVSQSDKWTWIIASMIEIACLQHLRGWSLTVGLRASWNIQRSFRHDTKGVLTPIGEKQ